MTEDPIEGGLKQIRDYWEGRASSQLPPHETVEMSSRAQRMRYEAFLLDHDLTKKTVLDLGCGAGGFLEHLRRRGIECHYIGVDLSEKMVELSRDRFPGCEFHAANILEWTPGVAVDYVCSFGIHNVRAVATREILSATTRRQFEMSRVAAHVSLLTDRYPGFAPHILAWRAEEVLSLALEISPFAVLRHDYLPNDLSVTLYRQPLIDTRAGLLLGEPDAT